jgi:hypothetical protein
MVGRCGHLGEEMPKYVSRDAEVCLDSPNRRGRVSNNDGVIGGNENDVCTLWEWNSATAKSLDKEIAIATRSLACVRVVNDSVIRSEEPSLTFGGGDCQRIAS